MSDFPRVMVAIATLGIFVRLEFFTVDVRNVAAAVMVIGASLVMDSMGRSK